MGACHTHPACACLPIGTCLPACGCAHVDDELERAAQDAATAHLQQKGGGWKMVMRAVKVVAAKSGASRRGTALHSASAGRLTPSGRECS